MKVIKDFVIIWFNFGQRHFVGDLSAGNQIFDVILKYRMASDLQRHKIDKKK